MIRRCGRIAPGNGLGPATGQPGLADPARIAARSEMLSRFDRPATSGRGGSGRAVSGCVALAIVSPSSRSSLALVESVVRIAGLGGVSTCAVSGAESCRGVRAASALWPFSAGSAVPESGVTVLGGAVQADAATDAASKASNGLRAQRWIDNPVDIMRFTLMQRTRRGNAGRHLVECVARVGTPIRRSVL